MDSCLSFQLTPTEIVKQGGHSQKTHKKESSDSCLNPKYLLLLIKLSIILLCTTGLIIQGKACISRYLKYETTAVLTVKPTGEATFPAFTVCPAFERVYKDTLLKQVRA